jgi:alkanesulfonate monooxygenase SsuD/methylene tetrahydromethanopterin reductase-like flavin-dependent oxidoreductase (luciferase family)
MEIGTVPETYQKPHPPLFQPFSFSESSVRWAAQHNVVPITIVCDKEICTGQFKACQDGAAQVGKRFSFGQGIGITREMVVADTDEEAIAIAREAGCFIWTKFFEPFGFNAAIARPGENHKDVPNTFESMVDRGLTICGSPDTVSRKLERLFKDLPAEYFWAYIYNELVPQKAAMRTLELLTTKVLPRFTDKIR